MILPDANLLLYAYDSSSPFSTKAIAWWQSRLSGNEPVLLIPMTIFAFVRIATSPKAFANPLDPATAASYVQQWLKRSACRFTEMASGDIEKTFDLLVAAGTAGNLTSDAQLASVALRTGATVHSADSDFARFKGVRWKNPILP